MMEPYLMPFDVNIQSGEFAVREAVSAVLTHLDPLALEIEETSTVELVLAEVLNNVVEHAYPPAQPAGLIHIRCDMARDGLHFRIKDKGQPMPSGELPSGKPQNLDVALDDLPEGGFGWFLIKDLAKDLEYERRGEENRLTLRIALKLR